jgi:two-component system, OmpR family, catabolic regulation response regulator CreB
MKEKILIVEDEAGIAENITYSLSTEGYESFWVTTGQSALDKVNQETIDLIILDIGLPDMSGFDILKEIRKSKDTPVLFLTARSEEIDRIVGLELGADDYVIKPFSPRELTARIKAILRRTNQNNSSKNNKRELVFVVDSNKRQISYYNKILNLSRYEYEILCLFINRPGWVFSREKIMDMVWDEPEESFDRTVDAHIKTIRAKLKEINNDIDPIETHRGVGYSLRDCIIADRK